ncbi:MAG: ATP-binding protein [Rhodospirillaceae bacterium]|nr:ATP-binding protein [Rhodospirillaceae bacterium]
MPFDRTANLNTRVVLLGLAAIVVIMSALLLRVVQTRSQGLDYAAQKYTELARTLEAGVSATLQSAELVADFAVLAAIESAKSGRSPEEAYREFIALAQRWPFIQSVGFIDAAGRISTSVGRDVDGNLVPGPSAVDLTKRDTFTSHRDATAATDALFLSEVREGYNTGTPILIMSKGIWSADGRFLGIAAVGIRHDAITDVFNAIAPAADSSVTLVRADGVLLAGLPAARVRLGDPYPNAYLFREALKASAEGAYDGPGIEDGLSRRVVYRAAPRYPVVVVIATSLNEILAEWRLSAIASSIVGVLSSIAIAGLTWSLVQRIRAGQRSQDALRESEGRLRDMLECSSDYMWETDANEQVIAFAGAATELYPPMIGRWGGDFAASTSEPNDLPQLIECVKARKPYRNLVIPALGRAGELRWARTSANPKFDHNGVYAGYRGVGSDITEVRKQQQLIEAQRKTEALGRLASGLAHEINNLLQPILIYSTSGAMAHDQRSDPRPFFGKISRAAEQASSIVRNVLTFTRRGMPKREPVWLAGAVREIVDLLSVRVPSGVRVTIDGAALDRMVHVDRTGLGQAVGNLLTNGVESIAGAKPGVGEVVVSAQDVSIGEAETSAINLRPGLYCRLTVTDNGPGIPRERLGNVFDPFFTTKPQSQGTGLGLSVVEGLVKTWGGAVTVASEPGRRTEFAIYLPQVEQQQVNAAQ